MPGTIQVSVMEFKGLSSTSTPTFLKVSLGKREYQTSNKGDFSFPLTTLRDNLVVRLVDAVGIEMAVTGIQTMSIVEKVSWDEIFPLDGGGHVHLKLQFILNEEERNRIRLKREAAVLKKQESIPTISHNPEIASSVGSSVASSPQAEQMVSDSQTRTVLRVANLDNVAMPASLLRYPDVSPARLQSNYGSKEGSILKQEIPKATDIREGTFSAPTIRITEAHHIASEEKLETQSSRPKLDINLVSSKEHSSDSMNSGSDVAEKSSLTSRRLDDHHVNKSQQQGPMEKTPSNVRKLVSAFACSQAKQDVKSAAEVPIFRYEPMKVGKGGHLKDSDPKDVTDPVEPSSGTPKNPFVAGELKPALETSSKRGETIDAAKSSVSSISNEVTKLSNQSSVAAIRSVEKELGIMERMESHAKLERSSTTEQVTTSGRMHTDYLETAFFFRLFAERRSSGGNLYAKERGRASSKIDIQVASVEKSKSLEYSEEEHFYSENSGMWIFPNNKKHLCITTAGKRVMNLLGNVPTEAKSNQNKKSSSSSGDTRKQGSKYHMKKQKESHFPGKSRSESSSDDASGGLVGQAIKIAIIVGFGVLVFFTRQREPRKSKIDTNDLFFITSDYMDEQTTTAAEQVD